jgi:hypothetical protein
MPAELMDLDSIRATANVAKGLGEMEREETNWNKAGPEEVVFLTSDDKRFTASKAILVRERYV